MRLRNLQSIRCNTASDRDSLVLGGDVLITCSNCGNQAAEHETACECGNFLGYPNVRKALAADEEQELLGRSQKAWAAADAIGARDRLAAFSDAILADSVAIVGRDLGTLDALAKSDNVFYIGYHRQVRAGARRPEENKWDAIRQQIDAAMFPNYFENILFASLSLDGVGDTNYGLYFIRLRDNMIRMRASVFEGNTIVFADRHNLRLADPVPPGYRASWGERHVLAVSKLHDQVSPSTEPADFPTILFKPNSAGDAEFIEVHIYGNLGVSSIDAISGAVGNSPEDKILWRSVKRRLTARGIAVQER